MKPLPKFTAVVHIATRFQAIEQTELALSHGAQGVFLIDHDGGYRDLLCAYEMVRAKFPAAWIGLNFLGCTPRQAFTVFPDGADALWMDSMEGFDASGIAATRSWRLFGGAAFKYQPLTQSCDLEASDIATRLRFADVVTTSGPGTGRAAKLQKVYMMRGAIGCDRLLALASGVTPANVSEYAPLVDCFLVATGISQSFHELDPAKVREVADQLRQNNPLVP